MAKNIVGLKELRENVEDYISRVEKGQSFIIVRKSKPVFKISSPTEEDAWEVVIDFTKISKRGIPVSKILSSL